MITFHAALAIALTLAQSHPATTKTFTATNNGHTVKVIAVEGPFDVKHRKVIEGDKRPTAKDGYAQPTLVDGRRAHGTDGLAPSRELRTLRVFIDRKEIKIPKSLILDLFNPNLTSDCFFYWVHKSGKFATIKMLGADAAGSYHVMWTVQRNGSVKRRFVDLQY